MFDSAQSKYKPVVVEMPVASPPPPPLPPVVNQPIATPMPPPSIPVPPVPTTSELPKVYTKKPFSYRVRFILPALILLLTMGLVAYVVSQNMMNKNGADLSATPAPSLIATTPIPTPKVDPKANWKSYVNQDLRLKFKYPQTLSLTEDTPSLTKKRITMKSDSSAQVISIVVAAKAQLASVLDTYAKKKEDLVDGSESDFQIADIPGVKVTGTIAGSGEGIAYAYGYVELDGTVYLISTEDGPEVDSEPAFDAFIDTLSFLPEGITDQWQTYQNTFTNYSIKYPPTWTVDSGDANATASAARVTIRKQTGETQYQNLVIDTSIQSGKEKIDLTASQIVSSLENLSGWSEHPTLDFRNIGGAQAQIVSGPFKDSWQMYVVLWNKNILTQMSWKDSSTRAEQETVDNMLSTFKFTK